MSLAPGWTCKACAAANGLPWRDGGASSDGGWCGVGQHAVPRGERIEFLPRGAPAIAEAVVLPAAKGVAIAAPVDGNGQMGLL